MVDRDRAREEYSADVVVVAAGAINSAALLLASANDRHPNGLGNSSNVDQRLLLRRRRRRCALGAMQMLGRSDPVTIGFDAPDAEDPAELARHSLDLWFTTDDLPLPENRVQLGADGGLRLRYTPTNLEAHRLLTERFR